MRKTTITLVIFLLQVSADPAAAAEQQVTWNEDLRHLDSVIHRDQDSRELEWIPASAVDAFVRLSHAELQLLGLDPETGERIRAALGLPAGAEVSVGDPVTALACMEAKETASLGSTALVLPSEIKGPEPPPTIQELVERAPVAVVLRIQSMESGVHGGGQLATRVEGEALRFLRVAPDLLDKVKTDEGVLIDYYTRNFDLVVGAVRRCAERPDRGFMKEKIGDTVLLLGLPRGPASYMVMKIFPVTDGIVQPQPYRLTSQQHMVLGEVVQGQVP